jgi:hypothetical protein
VDKRTLEKYEREAREKNREVRRRHARQPARGQPGEACRCPLWPFGSEGRFLRCVYAPITPLHSQSWYLSWALDTNEEERAKGKTVEVLYASCLPRCAGVC